MTRAERRRELTAQREAEQAAQEERERNCLHWNCRVTRSTWGGAPIEVVCEDCGGKNYPMEDDDG